MTQMTQIKMRVLPAVLAFVAAIPLAAQSPDLFAEFFDAEDSRGALAAADKLAGKVDFDTAYARLKKGRTYSDQKKGEFQLRWRSSFGPFFNNYVQVPADYDPAGPPIPMRVQLHGGVGRPSPNTSAPGRPQPGSGPNRIEGERRIYLQPSAWIDVSWWDEEGVDNILRAMDALKRKYNIDESRVYLTGISDGGTGAYYIAMKDPTPYASVLPLNGSIAVIKNAATGADGELYGNNIVNSPLYIVNGEQDPLYPVAQVEPHVRWFQAMGAQLIFRPQPGAGHNTSWWPTERAPFEKFVHEHPRIAHPEKLSWETEKVDRFNRVRWLVISELKTASGVGSRETGAADLDDTGFFIHKVPSGRVDIARAGNTFDAKSRGVAKFTLLLSPDVVDFSKPVVVKVNGKQAFSGSVKKDVGTLLRWSAKDNDRTMLYGAELKVEVPK